jgi:hypothetical protein
MRRNKKSDQLVKVWTVCPNDENYSTQHFAARSDADAWAKTYKSGAQVFQNELPQRVIDAKETRTARYGYGL